MIKKIYLLYFKTRGERRATKGEKRGRPSTTTMGIEQKKRAEVGKSARARVAIDQFLDIYMTEGTLYLIL